MGGTAPPRRSTRRGSSQAASGQLRGDQRGPPDRRRQEHEVDHGRGVAGGLIRLGRARPRHLAGRPHQPRRGGEIRVAQHPGPEQGLEGPEAPRQRPRPAPRRSAERDNLEGPGMVHVVEDAGAQVELRFGGARSSHESAMISAATANVACLAGSAACTSSIRTRTRRPAPSAGDARRRTLGGAGRRSGGRRAIPPTSSVPTSCSCGCTTGRSLPSPTGVRPVAPPDRTMAPRPSSAEARGLGRRGRSPADRDRLGRVPPVRWPDRHGPARSGGPRASRPRRPPLPSRPRTTGPQVARTSSSPSSEDGSGSRWSGVRRRTRSGHAPPTSPRSGRPIRRGRTPGARPARRLRRAELPRAAGGREEPDRADRHEPRRRHQRSVLHDVAEHQPRPLPRRSGSPTPHADQIVADRPGGNEGHGGDEVAQRMSPGTSGTRHDADAASDLSRAYPVRLPRHRPRGTTAGSAPAADLGQPAKSSATALPAAMGATSRRGVPHGVRARAPGGSAGSVP